MGAFDVAKPIRIPDDNGEPASEKYRKEHGQDATAAQEFRAKWGWEAHELVIIKGAYTGVEEEEVSNASSGIKGKGKNREVQVQIGTARNKLLQVMILDWTLAINGRKVDVTDGAILKLKANYRKPILEVCDEIAQTMDEEEEEDFLHSANGHSPESSQETSLSPMPS